MKLPKIHKEHLEREDFVKMLRSKGYRHLSSGAFASVYAKKGEKHVIKIGRVDEDGYIDYVKKMDSRNPFFPKIRNIKIFRDSDKDKWYAIKMERLIPYHKVRSNDLERKLGIAYQGIDMLDSPADIMTPNKHFRKFLKVLDKLYDNHNSDIHEGNIMFRKRGRGHQLVVTDPIV